MALHLVTILLLWLHPDPRNVRRLTELERVAVEITATDATEAEAELLVAICLHESRCHTQAVGDGSKAHGAWQVRGGPPTAIEALRRVRWSLDTCGDLSLYAGCGWCGRCPAIALSLADPTLARR